MLSCLSIFYMHLYCKTYLFLFDRYTRHVEHLLTDKYTRDTINMPSNTLLKDFSEWINITKQDHEQILETLRYWIFPGRPFELTDQNWHQLPSEKIQKNILLVWRIFTFLSVKAWYFHLPRGKMIDSPKGWKSYSFTL